MIKTLRKLEVQRILQKELSQHVKGRIRNNHSSHHTEWQSTERFPSEIRNKVRMPCFTTTIQHMLEVLAQEIREEKETKAIKLNWKK